MCVYVSAVTASDALAHRLADPGPRLPAEMK
jgi:hypothetical protein